MIPEKLKFYKSKPKNTWVLKLIQLSHSSYSSLFLTCVVVGVHDFCVLYHHLARATFALKLLHTSTQIKVL